MQVEFSHDEAEILAHMLQERTREMRFEIAHTDHRQYRESLNHRLEVLEGILARVERGEKRAEVA